MPSTNGYGPKRAVLYARVSTDEQARSGYSLAQQIEALREYASQEGYEVLEEVADPGQSGASLERPGMDRVRDLVTEGGVSVVLAQDRDRFAREPAYHYLLRREFEERGTRIRALNDRGDDTPEGELTDGILDQLAKYERAKIAERSRRGKLQKARQGKIVAGPRPNFGFAYNTTRDNYVVDEVQMQTIRRIFREVGAEGKTMYTVKRALDREGVKPPLGGRFWSLKYIRDRINDDVYKTHPYDEVSALVSPEVAARLDPSESYGVWWFNRRRHETRNVAESGPDGERRYRRQSRVSERPRSEWIAVPVPDPGILREWVDRAREAIKGNAKPSANANRVWELSGGVLLCSECGCRMVAHTTTDKRRGSAHHYYRCAKRNRHGAQHACAHGKYHRAKALEGIVWDLVSALLKDPERLRTGLDRLIEQERAGTRGNSDREANAWLEQLAEVEQERRGYLRLAAKGHMTDDDLAEALAELEDIRATAERELKAIRRRKAALEELELDKDALLEYYSGLMPDALDNLVPEERRQVYGMLRLTAEVAADGSMEARGVLSETLQVLCENGRIVCENGVASAFTTSCRRTE
jgi:site-specific DNA recombinase